MLIVEFGSMQCLIPSIMSRFIIHSNLLSSLYQLFWCFQYIPKKLSRREPVRGSRGTRLIIIYDRRFCFTPLTYTATGKASNQSCVQIGRVRSLPALATHFSPNLMASSDLHKAATVCFCNIRAWTMLLCLPSFVTHSVAERRKMFDCDRKGMKFIQTVPRGWRR